MKYTIQNVKGFWLVLRDEEIISAGFSKKTALDNIDDRTNNNVLFQIWKASQQGSSC